MHEQPGENVGTRLMFENERVRVWDLALAPGESLDTHIHREDFLFIVVNGGSLRHVDAANPTNDQRVQYHDDQVVFIEAKDGTVHNRLVNVGDTPYRNFVIELKRQAEP
jgi:mannose-6-phosphate isomerase-like protein (cupin superfamily)